MGLPRSARMRRRDFRASPGERGPRAAVGPLVMQVMHGSRGRHVTGPVKVGFAVGRPVGGAVTRNALRRRLREAAAASLPLQRTGVPRDGAADTATLVLVRARPGAERLGLAELTDHLGQAWRRMSGGGRR